MTRRFLHRSTLEPGEKPAGLFSAWFDTVAMLMLMRHRRVRIPKGWLGYWLPTPTALCVMSVSDAGGSSATILASFALSVVTLPAGYLFLVRSSEAREKGRARYYALTALMGSVGAFGMKLSAFSLLMDAWMFVAYLNYSIRLDQEDGASV